MELTGQIRCNVTSREEDFDQWDRFVSHCPEGHVEQSGAWARVKQIYGWKATCLSITRDWEICGGMMIYTRQISGFASIAYVERGPIWRPGDLETMTALTDAACRFASSQHIAYFVIALPYFGSEAISLLESLGFRQKPNAFPPTNVGRATLLVDLTQNLDTLMAGMSMTKRQNIRRATRKGVQIRIGDFADADLMRDLMWMTCRRRGTSPVPARRDYFQNLWRFLGAEGRMKFFIAEVCGEPVAGATAFLSGERMELWRVGWSGAYEELNPNDLLHWEMMKWAKENGCRIFDFLHIEPEHARAILRGEKLKDAYSGVTDFKVSFGGQIRLLPELYYRTFSPAANVAFKFGAGRLVESPGFQRAVNHISTRLMTWTAN